MRLAFYVYEFEVLITTLGLFGVFALGGTCAVLGSGPPRI